MKTSDLEKELGFGCLQPDFEDGDIEGAYTSDLLSDVMANAPEEGVLITIQAHKNTIAVASLAGLRAVVLCNKRVPEDDMLAAAADEGIAVFQTEKDQFTTSCLIGGLMEQ